MAAKIITNTRIILTNYEQITSYRHSVDWQKLLKSKHNPSIYEELYKFLSKNLLDILWTAKKSKITIFRCFLCFFKKISSILN